MHVSSAECKRAGNIDMLAFWLMISPVAKKGATKIDRAPAVGGGAAARRKSKRIYGETVSGSE